MMMDVFIVEDEEMIQQLYKDILSMRGYNVAGVACTGEEAVEMFRGFEKKPDLVIMDHRMPGMGGLDAARMIQDIDPEMKIILVSADDNAVWEALKMGIVGMKKPFNMGDLLSTIEASIPKSSIPGPVKEKVEPILKKNGLYLVEEEDGERGFELFTELTGSGYSGLM
ncbi:MAG: response regulator, partial [Candidatus Thermoplasmatota archaeon]|nr:response regulator [Candidatus Thermoplasmatota archaeon]